MVKYLRQSPFIFPCIYNGHNVFLIEQYISSVSYPLLYTRAKIRASSMKPAQVVAKIFSEFMVRFGHSHWQEFIPVENFKKCSKTIHK